MRPQPSILHVDLDAFFASVEQRDKPSLRGRPVVVGGLGPRGVVATASYEARRFGVGSAMPMAQARALCPNAAFLAGRFGAYRSASEVVMRLLGELSPLIEPLSLDEAFVDLTPGRQEPLDTVAVRATALTLKATIEQATGLSASVAAATSKLVAKIASDLDKPNGLVVVPPGTETALLGPMPVTRLWSVGPATADRLRRSGVHTVAELADVPEEELVGLLGRAHGRLLAQLASGDDSRPVVPGRESKSVSVEDTFDRDVVERAFLHRTLDRMAEHVCRRLRKSGLSGRTVTVKIRQHDFITLSRSATVPAPTDDVRVVARVAQRLLGEIDTADGIRLLGVGVTGLVDWSQEDLFASYDTPDPDGTPPPGEAEAAAAAHRRRWVPGQDVSHAEYGRGWVWGAGLGRVTVRFETRESGPGPVHTFHADDPALSPAGPYKGGEHGS